MITEIENYFKSELSLLIVPTEEGWVGAYELHGPVMMSSSVSHLYGHAFLVSMCMHANTFLHMHGSGAVCGGGSCSAL